MKKMMILSLIFAVITIGFSQESQFKEDMAHALALEDTASSYNAVVKAAKNLGRLSEEYPDNWLVLYWTAHVYSQCAVFSTRSAEKAKYSEYMDLAQAFYDKAWAAHKEKDKIDEADLYALQANIHSLRIGQYSYREDWDNVKKHSKLKNEFLEKAEQANPDNPMAWMLKGLGLLRNEETRGEGQKILVIAIKKYEDFPPKSEFHPRWGRQWIDFWAKRYGLTLN